jgi:hypothetical protein
VVVGGGGGFELHTRERHIAWLVGCAAGAKGGRREGRRRRRRVIRQTSCWLLRNRRAAGAVQRSRGPSGPLPPVALRQHSVWKRQRGLERVLTGWLVEQALGPR